MGGGGKMAEGCWEVTVIIADLTVGSDGCRSQAIYIGSARASQKEALSYHGRQSHPERVPPGW